jgi:UDP-N-acetylmuramoylalanine--D-glutamate ligase
VTFPQTMPWKKAGVMGLGLSGVAAAGFLARRGVEVVAADAKGLESLSDEARALALAGVTLRAPATGPSVFASCEVVIASPGVPSTASALAEARASGIPIIAEVELAARWLRGVLIGITGSNGKSTVTALVGRILETAGIPARVCGNIGVPLTAVVEQDLALPEEQARRVHYVAELSSFQLEGIERLGPRIAVLLNLSPDHQDRYQKMEDYYAAKARIFMNQAGDDIAIVNWDDSTVIPVAERLAARLFPFSLAQDLEEGAVLDEGRLVLRLASREETIMDASDVPIPGRHNLENVLAAASAAFHCGVPAATIAKAVRAFKALPHRLEWVASVAGVDYYNDSKATNVGSTLRAMEAFTRPIVLLLGGYDKGGDFESLRRPLSAKGALVRALVTFGKAGDDIARRLEGSTPTIARSGSLAEALKAAVGLARSGDIILLAPGCASFDAYTGFDKRGEDFRALVGRLASQAGGQL